MDLNDIPDQPTLIGIWQDQLVGVADLAETLDAEQWQAGTPCPGWSIGDVVAHLIDIEELLAQNPRPAHEPDWDALPHIQGDFGRFTEVGVDYRRGRSQEAVIAELRELVALRRSQLDDVPDGAEVVGPFGNPTTVDRLLRIRTMDGWMHEQDIRAAAGIDGGWESRGAVITYQQIQRAIPVLWAKTSEAPAGSAVHVRITGPGLVGDVAAAADADGRGAECAVPEDPTVRVAVSWPDLVSLASGRIDPSDVDVRARLTIDGDQALAATFLSALAITP